MIALASVESSVIPSEGAATGLCWRSLAPDTGIQDIALGNVEPALASRGPTEVWLSWQEHGPRILRWAQGRWSPTPTPARHGAETLRYPVVGAAPSGDVTLVVSANGNDGTSALHVARWANDSWQWLGDPLLSTLTPFTHAHEASIAFQRDGKPIVAWSEERDVRLAGLFVAKWDGSRWHRLGALKPDGGDYYLAPTLTTDAARQVWLGWVEGRPDSLRVACWDGKAWRDIGREGLQEIASRNGSAAQPSLAVDSKGSVWILWLASKEPGKASLALARWNGTTWMSVPVPRAPDSEDATASSGHMILRDDLPIVAWSQADSTENRRLFVSEWKAGDRWNPLLTGFHLVEGVSNVTDVRLAAGDARSFFVSWDETGKDERRTRLVQAYLCQEGETPVSPPRSLVERDTWPTSVDEAARIIAAGLDADSRSRVRSTEKDDLIRYHLSWGMGIRNSLGLWRGNEKLLESCGRGTAVHPDECSSIIIEATWQLLQKH